MYTIYKTLDGPARVVVVYQSGYSMARHFTVTSRMEIDLCVSGIDGPSCSYRGGSRANHKNFWVRINPPYPFFPFHTYFRAAI